ncbi:mediator of DNA damage checkpoint protein 1-like isoform X2 [Alligator mississippiensis]|uniref:mediator of DNA damage checkpoint protein 1-like isoform X2 n=1 Tax=Alligator mississippiensis TaxID=8496 RepID=UPI00287753A8|nr:mediator of DNA damage checkpoint protein 1-like isoform X2 [Alligator mississippiensis]
MEQTQLLQWEEEQEDEAPADPGRPVGRLRVLGGRHGPERDIWIYPGENVVGRLPSCPVHLPVPSVSKLHAVIEAPRPGPGYPHLLWDRGSLNRTRRGRAVLQPHVRYALAHGDTLLFGDVGCQYFLLPPGESAASPLHCLTVEETPTPCRRRMGAGAQLAQESEVKKKRWRGGSEACTQGSGSLGSPPPNTVVPESDEEAEDAPSPSSHLCFNTQGGAATPRGWAPPSAPELLDVEPPSQDPDVPGSKTCGWELLAGDIHMDTEGTKDPDVVGSQSRLSVIEVAGNTGTQDREGNPDIVVSQGRRSSSEADSNPDVEDGFGVPDVVGPPSHQPAIEVCSDTAVEYVNRKPSVEVPQSCQPAVQAASDTHVEVEGGFPDVVDSQNRRSTGEVSSKTAAENGDGNPDVEVLQSPHLTVEVGRDTDVEDGDGIPDVVVAQSHRLAIKVGSNTAADNGDGNPEVEDLQSFRPAVAANSDTDVEEMDGNPDVAGTQRHRLDLEVGSDTDVEEADGHSDVAGPQSHQPSMKRGSHTATENVGGNSGVVVPQDCRPADKVGSSTDVEDGNKIPDVVGPHNHQPATKACSDTPVENSDVNPDVEALQSHQLAFEVGCDTDVEDSDGIPDVVGSQSCWPTVKVGRNRAVKNGDGNPDVVAAQSTWPTVEVDSDTDVEDNDRIPDVAGPQNHRAATKVGSDTAVERINGNPDIEVLQGHQPAIGMDSDTDVEDGDGIPDVVGPQSHQPATKVGGNLDVENVNGKLDVQVPQGHQSNVRVDSDTDVEGGDGIPDVIGSQRHQPATKVGGNPAVENDGNPDVEVLQSCWPTVEMDSDTDVEDGDGLPDVTGPQSHRPAFKADSDTDVEVDEIPDVVGPPRHQPAVEVASDTNVEDSDGNPEVGVVAKPAAAPPQALQPLEPGAPDPDVEAPQPHSSPWPASGDNSETDAKDDPDLALQATQCYLDSKAGASDVWIYPGENAVGRLPSCPVHLPAPSVSKVHAVIETPGPRPGHPHLLWDRGSLNRTRRGRAVLQPHVRYALAHGDTLLFGDVGCQYFLLPPGQAAASPLPCVAVEETPTPGRRRAGAGALLAQSSEEEKARPHVGSEASTRGSGSLGSPPHNTVVPESDEETEDAPSLSPHLCFNTPGGAATSGGQTPPPAPEPPDVEPLGQDPDVPGPKTCGWELLAGGRCTDTKGTKDPDVGSQSHQPAVEVGSIMDVEDGDRLSDVTDPQSSQPAFKADSDTDVEEIPDVVGPPSHQPAVEVGSDTDVEDGDRNPEVGVAAQLTAASPRALEPLALGAPDPDLEAPQPRPSSWPSSGDDSETDAEDDPNLALEATQCYVGNEAGAPAPGLEEEEATQRFSFGTQCRAGEVESDEELYVEQATQAFVAQEEEMQPLPMAPPPAPPPAPGGKQHPPSGATLEPPDGTRLEPTPKPEEETQPVAPGRGTPHGPSPALQGPVDGEPGRLQLEGTRAVPSLAEPQLGDSTEVPATPEEEAAALAARRRRSLRSSSAPSPAPAPAPAPTTAPVLRRSQRRRAEATPPKPPQRHRTQGSSGLKAPGDAGSKARAPEDAEREASQSKEPEHHPETLRDRPTRQRAATAPREPEHHPETLRDRPTRQRAATAPRVLFTGVVDAAGEQAVVVLGGTLADSVFECTHLVTDRVRRTLKFLCALARGVPIVTPAWLDQSKRSHCFLEPSGFVVQDPEQEENFGFSLTQSLRRARRGALLQGYEIHVTRHVQPEPERMKELIVCSGGLFLPRMPRAYKPKRLVLSCVADLPCCRPALAVGLPVASAEFLLTGVLRQEAELGPYCLDQPQPLAQPAPSTRKRKGAAGSSGTTKRRH